MHRLLPNDDADPAQLEGVGTAVEPLYAHFDSVALIHTLKLMSTAGTFTHGGKRKRNKVGAAGSAFLSDFTGPEAQEWHDEMEEVEVSVVDLAFLATAVRVSTSAVPPTTLCRTT